MDEGTLVLGLTGDVMVGRNVNDAMNNQGTRYIWGDLLPILRATDLNIINLEAALTRHNQTVPKTFHFKADPQNVSALKDANIHLVNLANNHVLDYGEEGLLETLEILRSAGILFVGAGKNSREAARPVILTAKGLSIGVLGFTDNEPRWKAGTSKPGVNYIDIAQKNDREFALSCIREAKKEADFIVVSIHWGPNLKATPGQLYTTFAQAMIDCGASLVHGHSAHNFQGIERRGPKLIFYDTGDFVDDYMVHPELKNDHSFFFRVTVDKGGIKSAKLLPVLISHCQVNLAKGKQASWSLQRMQTLSSAFATTISDDGEIDLVPK